MRKFKRVYIEITNVCNLSCKFCPKTQREEQFLSLDSFETILKKLQGHTNHIYLHVMGEPLIHPLLKDFLRVAKDYNFYVNITTNGTLLKQKGTLLLNSPALRQVNISIHSFDENKGSNPINFDTYFESIFWFVRESLKNKRPYVSLRLWNLNNEATNLNYEVILKEIESQLQLDFEIKANLTPGSGLKLKDNIHLTQAESFEWPNINVEKETLAGYCYGLRDQIAILVDGTVVPCCLDSEAVIKLGNIFHSSLVDILSSERATNIYNNFSNRKVVEELCKKCTFRLRFNN